MTIFFRYGALLFLKGISCFVWSQSNQNSDSAQTLLKPIFSYQGSIHRGFIFAHSQDVQNTAGAHPTGIEVSITRQKNDESTWNLCNCKPQHGVMLGFYDFDNVVLGKAFHLSYVLEPWFLMNRSNSFSIKSVAGACYLTNPYHYLWNPSNQSYSTTVSSYVSVGVGWWHRLTDRWWVASHVHYQHTSNGGFRTPNKGVNWPTGSLTISYRPKPQEFKAFTRSPFKKGNKIRLDLGLFGVNKREGGKPDGKSDRYLAAGIVFQAAKQVGRINNFAIGSEFVWDGAVGSRMKREGLRNEPWQASALLGHEFILGKFLFSQRVGIYLYQPADYFDLVFHRWGLMYRFNPRWSIGFSLKAHRHIADYTDFRVVYSFY